MWNFSLFKLIPGAARYRARMWLGLSFSRIALTAEWLARGMVHRCYPFLWDENYYPKLRQLHREIRHQMALQRKEYPHLIYEEGYLYQALHMLHIFGVRSTEERFRQYGLESLLSKTDRVLDVGCNCGFMLLYSAFRTGCNGEGVDVNPYLINIGWSVSQFLGLSDRVTLYAKRFQDFSPNGRYSVIFSFACHNTDDEQHRPDFDQYMQRLHDLLIDGGIVVFESHTVEVGKPEFYERMERQRHLFRWDGSRRLDRATRELFILRKR